MVTVCDLTGEKLGCLSSGRLNASVTKLGVTCHAVTQCTIHNAQYAMANARCAMHNAQNGMHNSNAQ